MRPRRPVMRSSALSMERAAFRDDRKLSRSWDESEMGLPGARRDGCHCLRLHSACLRGRPSRTSPRRVRQRHWLPVNASGDTTLAAGTGNRCCADFHREGHPGAWLSSHALLEQAGRGRPGGQRPAGRDLARALLDPKSAADVGQRPPPWYEHRVFQVQGVRPPGADLAVLRGGASTSTALLPASRSASASAAPRPRQRLQSDDAVTEQGSASGPGPAGS